MIRPWKKSDLAAFPATESTWVCTAASSHCSGQDAWGLYLRCRMRLPPANLHPPQVVSAQDRSGVSATGESRPASPVRKR